VIQQRAETRKTFFSYLWNDCKESFDVNNYS